MSTPQEQIRMSRETRVRQQLEDSLRRIEQIEQHLGLQMPEEVAVEANTPETVDQEEVEKFGGDVR